MRKRAGRATRFIRHHFGALVVWGIAGGFTLAGVLMLWSTTLHIPDLASLEERQVEQSVKIYDRTGSVLLYNLHNEKQRTIVPLEEISLEIQNAVVAIEDDHFYEHDGIRPTSIVRAVLTNLLSINPLGQGGSTITQQVVKGSLLVNDKTIARKLKEWILAIKLEQVLSKDQILELYLNQVPLGGSLYGVEEASQTFFGKSAQDVTAPEAAYLAAVLPAPSRLSPYRLDETTGKNEQLEVRHKLVLNKMHEHGYLSDSELEAARAAEVVFQPPRASSIAAPHFVFYVQQYLEDKYGADVLEESGWRVITTLDADLQVQAEEIVQRKALENTENFNASNAALIALDPTNGNILSMVGSRNYFDTEIPGAYNVTTATPGRQPGSAFKPFAYAEAFAKGFTPDTVLFDLRTQFSTACASANFSNEFPCYSPVNYDNEFRGPITMRNALAQSINVPAVKTIYLAGLTDTLKLAKAMGISTLGDPGRYGLTLVLGGGEVTLLDISSAYGVFANNGVRVEPIAVLRIEDNSGNTIEDSSDVRGTQVLERTVAQQVNDVLSDTVARGPLTGGSNYFNFPGRDVAIKTGTTNDYRDAWTIGYTPNLVVGTWAGNNDNTSMERRVSGFIVGPIWSEFTKYAVATRPNQAFSRIEINTSGLKPVLRGIWQGNETYIDNGLEYARQEVHSILHWVDTDNPQGPVPLRPENDFQYNLWEAPVRGWALINNRDDGEEVLVGSEQEISSLEEIN